MKDGSKKASSLIKALKTQKGRARDKAIVALAQFDDQQAVEPLIAALKDENPDVRWPIMTALGNLRDKRACEPLITILQTSKDKGERNSAALALGNIGDGRAFESLIAAFQDEELRWSAGYALGRLGDSRAIQPLVKALDNELGVDGAILSLVEFGELTIEPLAETLRHGSSTAHRNAADTIRQIWFHQKARDSIVKSVVEPLVDVLHDENDIARAFAVLVLSDIRDMRAFKPLLEMVKDDSAYVRWCLSWSLAQFNDVRAIPALEWVTQNDEGWQIVKYGDESRKEMNSDRAARSIEYLKQKIC